jgi:hypothetical protein
MLRSMKVVVGIWALAVVPVAALYLAMRSQGVHLHYSWLRYVAEALTYLAIMLVIACCPSIRRLLGKLEWWRATVLAVMLCGLLVGQMTSRAKLTFPFLVWNMYTTPNSDVRVLEFDAVHVSGKKQPYPFTEFSPSAYYRPFMNRFAALIPDPKKPDTEGATQKLSDALLVLVRLFNDKHQQDPIIKLCLSRSVFQAKKCGEEDWVHREQILCVEAERP